MKKRANKQSGATIKDVANLAGVSAMTVSRVLNAEPNVRPATRDRVREAVLELNYRPNISARSLAKAQSFFIALLYDNPSAGYISELLIGALGRCRKAGYHLVLENCGEDAADWSQGIAGILATSSFDGIIIPPPVCDFPEVLTALEDAEIPYVRLAPHSQPERSPQVRTDDRDAARRMTEYLIDLGHSEIGFIKGHPDHGVSALRYEGYCDALRKRGLPTDDRWVAEGLFTYKSGLDAAETLLDRPDRPTAIFSSNDDMAAAVIALARKFELDVPVDLSVVGFDDTQTAQSIWPQLTTVRQPIAEMASGAIDLLTQHVTGELDEDGDRVRQFDCEIIIRDSSARRREG